VTFKPGRDVLGGASVIAAVLLALEDVYVIAHNTKA